MKATICMRVVVTMFVAVLPFAIQPSAQSQTYVTFDPPNSVGATQGVNSITQAGSIVGNYQDLSFVSHGFLRAANGSITTIDAPGAGISFFQGTVPSGINQPGTITGYYVDGSYNWHGFVRDAKGTMTEFDATSTSVYTNAVSINQAGVITGYYADAATYPNTNCFLRSATGAVTTFSPPGSITSNCLSINNSGVIVGYYQDASSASHGFVLAANGTVSTIDAPDAGTGFFQGTAANAINQAGVITGSYVDAGYAQHGFVRAANGTITPFDPPNSLGTYPGAINPAGEITGYYFTPSGGIFVGAHGFVRAANGTITTLDPPGSTFTFGNPNNNQVPVSINPAGVIAGTYSDANGEHGFVRTP